MEEQSDRLEQAQSIVVDLSNLACPSGCCRFQLLDIDGSFFEAFLQDLLPSVLAKKLVRGTMERYQKVPLKG